MKEKLHKHHIVPRHMGGLGPGHPQEHLNIMELSREDHAWAHLILYKMYGYEEDLWSAHINGLPQDISGENNPMANPEYRKRHQEAIDRRDPESFCWNGTDGDAYFLDEEGKKRATPELKKILEQTNPRIGKFGKEASNYKDGRQSDDPKKYQREYQREYRKTDKYKKYRKELRARKKNGV